MTGVDEIFILIEDNQVSIQTMLNTRFVSFIRSSVEEWDQKLAFIHESLTQWLSMQRNWSYLESIFSAPDIQQQLPAETQKFQNVD